MSTPQYPPLPVDVDGAVVALQRHIDTWREGMFPTPVESLRRLVEERAELNPDYLAQREKMAELGLDPDILAPLPVDVKHVRSYVNLMTCPEDGLRDWLTATGFSAADVETIMSRLELVPADVVEYVDSLDDGETVDAEGRMVDVVVDPARATPHPLSVGVQPVLGRGEKALGKEGERGDRRDRKS